MKIFYITPRVPYPIDKGDKLRAFYQIKYLSEKNEIFLYALDEGNSKIDPTKLPFATFCKKITVESLSRSNIIKNLLSGIFRNIPFQTSYYYSKRTMKNIITAIDRFKPDLIYCQLIRCAQFVIDIKDIPKVIDYVDVISKGLERRKEKSNLFWKIFLWFEFRRALFYEQKVYNSFNRSIIITEEDKSFLPLKDKSNVSVYANGIDLEYFHPMNFKKKYDLFFTGNLSYPPNIDASKFLATEILPRLQQKYPDIKILIAGASPSKKVLELQSKNVTVKGWTDDLRDYYKAAKIFVAPLRIGTGLQNKLLQAMAMEIPCVVSELAGRGISNSKTNCFLNAESVEDYFKQIDRLLCDERFAKELANSGYSFVKENFSWGNISEKMNQELVSLTYE